jgi:hypothetical protein
LLAKARAKVEDSRTAELLLEEVIEDITSAGPEGMPSWQVENAFNKLTRAVRLDERNEDAAALRDELRPVYERIAERKMAAQAGAEPVVGGEWGALYEKRLVEARRARKNREFEYARDILQKLLPNAPDDRANRELQAVTEDWDAQYAAEQALLAAANYGRRGDLEAALRELDQFAERYPRRAKAVEDERRKIEIEIERMSGGSVEERGY